MQPISELIYIDAAGYHYADYPTFLTWIQDLFKGIYGEDVYLGADSQDGQFLAAVAQAFFDTAAVGSSTYNSFSPVTAQGAGLSRVVKINGVERGEATHSVVDLDIGGTTGTVLTGTIAEDSLNQKWLIPTTTIPISGTITVTATAQDEGALQALPNTITKIFTPTQGWQTVNNPAAAIAGLPIVTDAQLRAEQAQSVADPSLTVFEGTVGAVQRVPGVNGVAVGYENDTGVTDANGIPAHSIAVVASGGTNADVAEAIRIHKTPGTRTFGTTSVDTEDSHGMPLTIHFYRPTPATIGVEVTITPGLAYISSTADLIADALAAAVSSPNIVIGGRIVLTKLYSVAYLPGTPQFGSFTVVSIRLKKNAGSFAAVDIPLNFNEIAECDPTTNVTVIT